MNTLTILLQAEEGAGGFSSMWIMGGLILICLYFFVVRPQRKKADAFIAEMGDLGEKELLQRVVMNTLQTKQQVAFLYWLTVIGFVLSVAGIVLGIGLGIANS